jgi:hypothetical protein
MNANDHRACYGAMFPDTLHAVADRPRKGKVFAYTLLSAGELHRAGGKTEVNHAAWDECVCCPEFEHCYKLSMAKLALDGAVANN